MNSLRTKSFTTIVFALIGASLLVPSFSSATAEPVWDDGTIVTHDDGTHWENGGGEVKSIVCSSRGDGGAQVALWVLLAGIGIAVVVTRRRQTP